MLYILMAYKKNNNMSTKDFITPRVDIAFKKIFGVDENKDLLISLINSIVDKEDQISSVTLLNPYNPQNFQNDKLSILDLKAQGDNGKLYNIEIQISNEGDYDKRALFYWAELYTQQLQGSDSYSKLNKTIGIHILNFISIRGVEKYHNVFHALEKDSKIRHFDDFELHTIELSKFTKDTSKKYMDKAEEFELLLPKITTALDKWVAFLTKHDLLKINKLPEKLQDTKIAKALAVLEQMNFNEEEREAYRGHLKWLRIEASTLKKASEESMEKGIEKGRIEGVEKGRIESKIEIAKNMLSQGCEIDLIAKVVGLSEDELIKLRDEAAADVST